MPTETLIQEIAELKEAGYKIETSEANGFVYLIFNNYPVPPSYNKRSTRLLLRLPIAYPQGNPDMFWTDTDLVLADKRVPTKADLIESHVGNQWRRFSWHPHGWNPGTGNLFIYLEFVDHGLIQAGKQ